MYDFGIRLNVGPNVGSGHFYRCLATALELRKNGKNVVFLLNYEKNILMILEKFHISYFVLKGESEIDRIEESKQLKKNFKFFIIDLHLHNEDYTKIFNGQCKSAVFDDIGNKNIYSEILFNGQIVKDFHNYSIPNNQTQLLVGPQFMILRNEFALMRKDFFISKNPIKKILLMFGANDDEKLIKKISPFFIDKDFDVTLVTGFSNYDDIVNDKNLKNSLKINIKTSVDEMAKSFINQDLVVTSPGITAYELSTLGVPSIFISSDPSQFLLATEMMKRGFGINYGSWDDDFQRFENILSQLNDFDIREKMYKNGRKIIDGKGLSRVVDKLINF